VSFKAGAFPSQRGGRTDHPAIPPGRTREEKMDVVERCMRIGLMAGRLMEKNQELQTTKERIDAGFHEIYCILKEAEIMLQRLKEIKRALSE
jgi:hypothetical protein